MADDKNKRGTKVKVGETSITITDPYGIRNFAGRKGKHSTGIDVITSDGNAIAFTGGTIVEVKAQSGRDIIDLTNFNPEDKTQAQKYENAKRVIKPTEGASGGFFVTVKHPDGTYGKYMHLDPISPDQAKNLIGKQVNRGESLGTYNQKGSGSMEGKHVKFRAFTDLNNSSKTHINPLDYLTGEKSVIPVETTLPNGTVVVQSTEGTDVQPFSMDGIDPEKFRNFVAAYKKEEDKAEIKESKIKESDARKKIEEAKKQKELYEAKKRESFMALMAEMSKEENGKNPQPKQMSPQQDFQMLSMQKSLPELPSIHRLPEFQDGGTQGEETVIEEPPLTKKQKREQDYYRLTMMMRDSYKHLDPETGKLLTPGELLFEGGEPIKKYEEKGFTPVTTKDFITWKVSGESFTPDPESFIDTGISPFNREDFESDQDYEDAYQKDRVVIVPRVVPKIGTMYVAIGTGEKSQKIAEDYNKRYGAYKTKGKQIIPYYTPPESNFEDFEKYRQQQLQQQIAPQQKYGGLFKEGGEVSRMGYRDDSPYRDRPYIDIETPTGIIDMSNTGIPLYANGKLLLPYSGQHQMGTNVVREVPVRK